MINRKNSSLYKKVYVGLLSLIILTASGCLFKKEVIPEYLPESPTKIESQRKSNEASESSSLAKALAEIKATTKKEDATSSSNTVVIIQEKEQPQKKGLAKNTNRVATKAQETSTKQLKTKKDRKKKASSKTTSKHQAKEADQSKGKTQE